MVFPPTSSLTNSRDDSIVIVYGSFRSIRTEVSEKKFNLAFVEGFTG